MLDKILAECIEERPLNGLCSFKTVEATQGQASINVSETNEKRILAVVSIVKDARDASHFCEYHKV